MHLMHELMENHTWTINQPKDATYVVTESGLMSNVIFEQWFRNSLIPHVSSTTNPVIFFFFLMEMDLI